jgi:hypothetical protein
MSWPRAGPGRCYGSSEPTCSVCSTRPGRQAGKTALRSGKPTTQVVKHAVTVFAGGHPSRSMLGAMPNVTTRVVLSLSEDTVVFFNDQRKFGWIRIRDIAALR